MSETSAAVQSNPSPPNPNAAPTAPPAPPAEVTVGADHLVELNDPTTNIPVQVPIGDLAKGYWTSKKTSELETKVKELEIYDKAFRQGDVTALHELTGKMIAPPAAPTDPRETEVVALRKELSELREALTPTVSAIREQAETYHLGQLVKSMAKDAPLLSRHPQAGNLVKAQKDLILSHLRKGSPGGPDPTQNPNLLAAVVQQAVKNTEAQLVQLVGLYGVDPAKLASPPSGNGTNPKLVDDRRPAPEGPGQARYKLVVLQDGTRAYVDTLTMSHSSTPVPPSPAPVNLPSGAGPAGTPAPAGPLTKDTLIEKMGARRRVIQGAI